MRRIRGFFLLLFISATLISALHEVIHDHHHELENHIEEDCPLYLMVHTPVVLNDTISIHLIDTIFLTYASNESARIAIDFIPSNSRSPPLS
ncbi:hypothetical protein [Sulfuricurvum sp.]|uniref:hypothetical protein n=1 Tax=Sulfuricurvum sp. TaxID=2025608 RepID=UPI003BB68C9E